MRAAPDPVARRTVALYRQQGCSCCTAYADYLRDNGFDVDVTTLEDLDQIRADHAIPEEAVGCHTSVADGYVVEGHVPVEAIDRLLGERPDVDGIAVHAGQLTGNGSPERRASRGAFVPQRSC